jgi:signal transduction histidine kinase
MERRYGFTSEQAIGRITHDLLHTTFPCPLHHIQAALLAHDAWSGGVIHHHADGRTVTAMSRWALFRAGADSEAIVIETYSSAASLELADLLAIFANELSQPLTAIGNYIDGAHRTLQDRTEDQELARKAMTLAGIQVMRGADQVRLLRRLASDLRQNG